MLFASARETLGRATVNVPLAAGEESLLAGVLRARLGEIFPPLAGIAACSRLAVNQEFADDQAPVRPGDEVALIPPVSGG
ncbi:MAG: MoaD/ThiS family protein [Planctomycetes bacterium]|nr:MoaD/ThiS family protein [Planctomycetota bacterium]